MTITVIGVVGVFGGGLCAGIGTIRLFEEKYVDGLLGWAIGLATLASVLL